MLIFLKIVFAFLLVVAGLLMLKSTETRDSSCTTRFGFWQRKFGKYEYIVNLWLALPISAMTGLAAGMVGISGASFKVPLMVLGCGVPMRVAIGTSSAMIATTAFMGFMGHLAAGDFNAAWVVPMSLMAVIGGLIGSLFSVKIQQEKLKEIFAYTTLLAAIFLIINTWLTFRS